MMKITVCCGFEHREVFLLYDDVFIPDELADIHPKAAIKYRNRWMIDHSDIILIYTKRSYGGAYEARRYAERIGRKMVYIGCEMK